MLPATDYVGRLPFHVFVAAAGAYYASGRLIFGRSPSLAANQSVSPSPFAFGPAQPEVQMELEANTVPTSPSSTQEVPFVFGAAMSTLEAPFTVGQRVSPSEAARPLTSL